MKDKPSIQRTTLAALLLIGYRRQQFFLVRGQLDAPITPVRWLGYSKTEPWTRFGLHWSIYITLGTLTFLVIAGRPSLATVQAALPYLPAALLLATMNAFSEELTYRASWRRAVSSGPGSSISGRTWRSSASWRSAQ